MIESNAEREFMMVIRQAALMVRAHIKRNQSALGELAAAIDTGMFVVAQWIEWRYEVKRPKTKQ